MNAIMARRSTMATLGAVAGLAQYGLYDLADAGVLSGRPLLALFALSATFFGTLLIMAGPLRPTRAALGAAGIALGVTLLLLVAALRFDTVDQMLGAPHIVLAALVLASVPMPFWIARNLGRWGDYPVLFGEAWSIVVRYGVAWTFTGVVWGVIFLSDALLGIVGLTVISDLIDVDPVPFLLTGAVLGLGLAVVQELQDYISPYLILRLLRLLLPVVLVVTAVFLVALPVQGISGLFQGLSVALTMLAMAGAAATLVTTAVDQEDAQATDSALLIWSARGMALLLPLLAGVGAWAIWLRVAQHGWTPSRVFAAEVAVIGLGYGVLYALAVLRGAGWMARIRLANTRMAIALVGLAALSLTPLLDAEAISARSHLARLDDGRVQPGSVDVRAMERWGRPGAAALAALRERSKEPGQEALAARLAAPDGPVDQEPVPSDLLAKAATALVLQPPGAGATRDLYLALLDAATLAEIVAACDRTMPGGGKGCVMVVADLLPDVPGEEAVLALWQDSGFASFEGFVQGRMRYEPLLRAPGGVPFGDQAAALIRRWQSAPPAVEPAPVNRFVGSGLMVIE